MLEYLLLLLTVGSVYMIASASLNLILGFSGLFSVAHAAFMAAGAYIGSLLMLKAGLGFFPALVAAFLGAGILSALLALTSLNMKMDQLVVVTISFQILTMTVLTNWETVTNGPYGLAGIPRPTLFGISLHSPLAYFVVTFVIAIISVAILNRLGKSPFGLVLKALHEDELTAASLGKNVRAFKTISFVVGSAFAGLAGVLFASLTSYIEPSIFNLNESVLILSMVVIGGSQNMVGSAVGALVLITVPELLRFVNLPSAVAGNVRQMLFGLLLIFTVFFLPQGILGRRKASVRAGG